MVSKKPGGATATCTGASAGGESLGDVSCTYHSQGERCHTIRTSQPSSPLDDVTVPPAEGVDEEPSAGDGGKNAGGGATAPPPTGADPNGGEPEQPVIQ